MLVISFTGIEAQPSFCTNLVHKNRPINMALKQKYQALIFTDLDGSLLDHDSYGFEAAKPMLKHLKILIFQLFQSLVRPSLR